MFQELFDEIDGRMTRVTIGWPETWGLVWKQQKHVRYALNNPEKVDEKKIVTDTRGWLIARMVEYPQLDEHFRPIVNKINETLGLPKL